MAIHFGRLLPDTDGLNTASLITACNFDISIPQCWENCLHISIPYE